MKDCKHRIQLRDTYFGLRDAASSWINTAKEKLILAEQLSNSHDDLLKKENLLQVTCCKKAVQNTCSLKFKLPDFSWDC